MKRLVYVLIAVALMLALFPAVVSGHAEGRGGLYVPPPPPDFPVKLAIIAPLSGPVSSFGESTRDGALLAIQEAQAAGWNIETVLADSKCDAQEAVNAANKVIFEDGVEYIIGAVCSSTSIPISEIAEANHVLQISPTSTAPAVTVNEDGTNKEYVFRACFLDPFQGAVMASVARELSATKAAVLYDVNNDYVRGLAEYFKDSFERMGGEVPVFEAYTSEVTDFSDLLAQVADADADVLFLPDYYGKVNEIAAQANTMGLQATFLGGDGWGSPDLRLDQLEGAYFSNHFWPGDPRQIVVDFVQSYSATYGTQPDALAALGYDATGILLQAIAEAGVDDPSVVKDEMATIAYEGVTDKITFNEFGDPIKGAAIIKIEGGQMVFVKFVAPVSKLIATNDSPTDLGDATTLTATVATGSDVTYTWALGDGVTASGPVVSHTYATAGAYTAVVTASNNLSSIMTTTTAVVRETRTISSGSVVTTSDQVLSIGSTSAMTQALAITYTPQLSISHTAGDLKLAGVTFHLAASYLPGGTLVIEPSEPLTLTVRYSEEALPPHMDEAKLEVHRYDPALEAWVPLQLVDRDTEGHTITVLLDHFSEYALLGPIDHYLYLPLVMR